MREIEESEDKGKGPNTMEAEMIAVIAIAVVFFGFCVWLQLNSRRTGAPSKQQRPEDRGVESENRAKDAASGNEMRDRVFDKTVADSFPASDPRSSLVRPRMDSVQRTPL